LTWSDRLSREAAAKVAAALARIQQGNFSNTEGVGGGVYEYRIDFGSILAKMGTCL
jgi:putative component of toxin-antitoxin plasmid stabilization module